MLSLLRVLTFGKKTVMTKVWVLTSEYNEYDQFGEYFISVYKEKPSVETLQKDTGCSYTYCQHIYEKGGRQNDEDVWFNLKEEEI